VTHSRLILSFIFRRDKCASMDHWPDGAMGQMSLLRRLGVDGFLLDPAVCHPKLTIRALSASAGVTLWQRSASIRERSQSVLQFMPIVWANSAFASELASEQVFGSVGGRYSQVPTRSQAAIGLSSATPPTCANPICCIHPSASSGASPWAPPRPGCIPASHRSSRQADLRLPRQHWRSCPHPASRVCRRTRTSPPRSA